MNLKEIETLKNEGTIEKVRRKRRRRNYFSKVAGEFWKIEHDLVVELNVSNLNFVMYVGDHEIGSCSVPVDFILASEKLRNGKAREDINGSDASIDGKTTAFHSLIPTKPGEAGERSW
jgi:hypothetical protein